MNILFPTDFSENAMKGLNFTIKFVNELGANLHIITSFEDPRPTGTFVSISDILRKDAENDLNKLVESVKDKVTSHIFTFVAQGEPQYAIANYAKRNGIDIIAMPTKGMRNAENMILGSVTKKVISESLKPVLVIPNDSEYHELHGKILFAVDANPILPSESVSFIKSLADRFSTSINFIHVNEINQSVPDELHESLKALFGNYFTELIVKESEGAPANVVTRYALENNYDFTVMIKRKKSFLKTLLSTSQSSKGAGITKVPLIIIQEEEK